jgi:hydroxyethylthiazole kinase-like uncharacterized protein yjeF
MSGPTIDDIDEALLRRWPLPRPDAEGDKNERGRVLLVGGSTEVPGAVLLAGTAALRAGAGKLAFLAGPVGLAMPEARVVALADGGGAGLGPDGAQALSGFARRVDALVLGPGWVEPADDFVRALLPAFAGHPWILDAMAMQAIDGLARAGSGPRVLLTPHAGELADLSGEAREAIAADPVAAALRSARRWNCTVALKGPLTGIAAPDGRLWRHRGGNVGLATSGSGDVLAGLVAALAARGASLEQAAAWGVALHARAGEALGPMGYLARELPAQLPRLMQALA